ncbi:transglutaminase domain-containing protein [Nitriliruptoraceae bacterium ZYF776]|nr:transglutaminase domain-containing protein [Profundirhabdus halotolerans]
MSAPTLERPGVRDAAATPPAGTTSWFPLVWAGVLLSVAAAHLGVAWQGVVPVVVLVAAAVLPLAITTLAFRIGVPGWLASGSVLTLLGLTAELVAGDAETPFGTAVRDAVPRLLTSPQPAPATADLLVPGVLLVAVAAVWVAVRDRRRSRLAVTPVVAAVVLYVAAALLTAGAADRHGIVAAVLTVLATLGWVGPSTWRGVRSVAVLAVLAGVAVTAAAVVPVGTPFEPRDHVDAPEVVLGEPSPLPRLAVWGEEGDLDLLRVSAERPVPLRLVALVDFDGATWDAPARYRPFGVGRRDDLGTPRRVAEVEVAVTVTGLDSPWVPTPGRPLDSSLDALFVDGPSGTIATSDRLAPGATYAVRAEVEDARAADVRDAAVLRGDAVARYVDLPDLPVDLAELARATIAGASSPLEQAVLIEEAVRGERRLDPTAPVGSSYARLRTFLLGTDAPGAQAGTSEQFATAFAVLARASGLPTRVVVGFQPADRSPDGTWPIRGRDALAWPEVHFEDWGWVRFAPTPDTVDVADQQLREQVLAERDAPEVDDPVDEPDDAAGDDDTDDGDTGGADDEVGGGADGGPVRTGLLVALLLVVALPVLLLLARAARRARHRRAGARGAWSELLDVLRLAGARPPASTSAPDVAAAVAARWPSTADPHPAQALATAADRAAFGPPGGRPDPEVWTQVRALRQLARRHVPWYRRATWPLDPRPLLGRRVSARRSGARTAHGTPR